jgi:hypothetical protein
MESSKHTMNPEKEISLDEAQTIGDELGVNWSHVEVEQFRDGLVVELGHGVRDPETKVTRTDLLISGKLVRARLGENPDYYTRFLEMQ